jgi:hypothetical protein
MYLYIHNHAYVKDLSSYGPNIYPLFHFISSCDSPDRIGSAHFCETKITIFRRFCHSFNYSMISSHFSSTQLSHLDPVLSRFPGLRRSSAVLSILSITTPLSISASRPSNRQTLPSSRHLTILLPSRCSEGLSINLDLSPQPPLLSSGFSAPRHHYNH